MNSCRLSLGRLTFGLLFVTLALAGCGKGCGKRDGEPAKKESFQLLPADSNVVLGIDWKKVQASPLGAKVNEGMPAEVQPLMKDVDGLVIGAKIEGMERDAKDFVGVLSGKLDSTAILAQMKQHAEKSGFTVQEQDYEGVKIYSTSNDATFGTAFTEGFVIFGKVDTVKKAIDLSHKKGESIDKNPAMMDLVKGVDKSKMLWAVASIPEGTVPQGGPAGEGNPMASLSSIKAIDLAVDYPKELTIDLGILAGSKEDAQQMMTMANSYKTLFGASLASKSPELGKILSALSIDAKESKVILALKLDQATVDELANKAKQNAPGLAPAVPEGGEETGDAGVPPPPPSPAATP